MNAPLTMAQVIQIGASRREIPRTCPFCATEPQLASKIGNRFVVACENDDCPARPQVCDVDLAAAWKKWNARI